MVYLKYLKYILILVKILPIVLCWFHWQYFGTKTCTNNYLCKHQSSYETNHWHALPVKYKYLLVCQPNLPRMNFQIRYTPIHEVRGTLGLNLRNAHLPIPPWLAMQRKINIPKSTYWSYAWQLSSAIKLKCLAIPKIYRWLSARLQYL